MTTNEIKNMLIKLGNHDPKCRCGREWEIFVTREDDINLEDAGMSNELEDTIIEMVSVTLTGHQGVDCYNPIESIIIARDSLEATP